MTGTPSAPGSGALSLCGVCTENRCCIGPLDIFLDDEDRTRLGITTETISIEGEGPCRFLGERGCVFGSRKPFMCSIYPVAPMLPLEPLRLGSHETCPCAGEELGEQATAARRAIQQKLRTADGRKLVRKIAEYYDGELTPLK